MEEYQHLVFASYTTADRARVEPVVDMLSHHGLDVWLDHRRIKPGQNWDSEIRRALDRASIILIFISDNSVNKRGYVQRELKLALAKAEEKTSEDIFIIPILLDDDVKLPIQLNDRQYIKVTDEKFEEKIIESINLQLIALGAAIAKTQEKTGIHWTFNTNRELRDGIPGYEADIKLIRLGSPTYQNLENINEIMKAEAIEHLMELRWLSMDQGPLHFNFGQEKYSRTNTLAVYCEEPHIKGRLISLQMSVHSFYAGAAHPNHYYYSFCFFLSPLFRINSLSQIFADQNDAFDIIQNEVRGFLRNYRTDPESEENATPELDVDWINKGTESWQDMSCFLFTASGVELCFSPYQVAAYAYGDIRVPIQYEKLNTLMLPIYRSALDLPDPRWITSSFS